MSFRCSPLPHPAFTRRGFIQGAADGALCFVPWPLQHALAAARTPMLSGTQFQLEIGPVNVTGRPLTGINGQIPGADPALARR